MSEDTAQQGSNNSGISLATTTTGPHYWCLNNRWGERERERERTSSGRWKTPMLKTAEKGRKAGRKKVGGTNSRESFSKKKRERREHKYTTNLTERKDRNKRKRRGFREHFDKSSCRRGWTEVVFQRDTRECDLNGQFAHNENKTAKYKTFKVSQSQYLDAFQMTTLVQVDVHF